MGLIKLTGHSGEVKDWGKYDYEYEEEANRSRFRKRTTILFGHSLGSIYLISSGICRLYLNISNLRKNKPKNIEEIK